MSLTNFLNIIDHSFVGRFFDRKLDVIRKTNPNRIYVENIRSFYHIPKKLAKFVCEVAVSEGVFRKKYGLICPNDDCERIVLSFDSRDEIPEYFECENCETQEREVCSFKTEDKYIITYYQLIDESSH